MRLEGPPASRPAVLAWLACVVLACYANSLSGAFQFDDYKVIVDNPEVQSWAAWLASLGHGIRPLLKLSYTLNWTSDLGLTGFHLVNLTVHLGNAWLVYLLAQTFSQSQAQREGLAYVPLITALLFAAHPIQTEAVTYVCGRSSSLMTLFYLAGLMACASDRGQYNKSRLYLLTPLLFVAALAVKETAVTFPFALLLWELACGGDWRSAIRRQWPNWVVLLCAATFFLLNEAYGSQIQRSAAFNSVQGNAATQLRAVAYLLRQWVLPLWLNIDPDLPLQRDFAGSAWPLMFFVFAMVLMLVCWRRRPWIGFALAWLVLHLVPLYLLLPRLDIANERQMVLAAWPLYLALGTELALRLEARTLKIASAALLLTLGTLTVLRNQVYVSEIALWQDTAEKSPHKARVHNNLGYAYQLAQRDDEARREFTLALQIDPQEVKARYNLQRLAVHQ